MHCDQIECEGLFLFSLVFFWVGPGLNSRLRSSKADVLPELHLQSLLEMGVSGTVRPG
jgi:hypothetical protein